MYGPSDVFVRLAVPVLAHSRDVRNILVLRGRAEDMLRHVWELDGGPAQRIQLLYCVLNNSAGGNISSRSLAI
jgi:hypothetical protein